MSGRRRLFPAGGLCVLALAACGGSDSAAPDSGTERGGTVTARTAPDSAAGETLSPSGIRVIQRARDEVSSYCRGVAEALAKDRAPAPADFEQATAAIDELAELAARQPEAETADGTTPRLALGDIAENLEGTNCDRRLVARIDQALAGLAAE